MFAEAIQVLQDYPKLGSDERKRVNLVQVLVDVVPVLREDIGSIVLERLESSTGDKTIRDRVGGSLSTLIFNLVTPKNVKEEITSLAIRCLYDLPHQTLCGTR